MNTEITMKTSVLLATIVVNRKKHKETVDKVFDKYRKMAIEQFEKYIEKAKVGKKVTRYLSLPEPKNHTKDYDLIISMLKAHVQEDIAISAEEYQNYVLDDWNWSHAFATSNSSYR